MLSLREMLVLAYGQDVAQSILAGYGTVRPVTLRINRLKTDAERVQSALASMGISSAAVPWYCDALILPGAREKDVRAAACYARGEIYLQSLSSMLPPLYLLPQERESVLDMTAAPGGKTTQLYTLSGGSALITACERDKIRFERLLFNLNRQGASRVTALNTDALALSEFFRFDKILLDAPCSGSGTVSAGEPVRIDEAFVRQCAALQEKLLKKALSLLNAGGTLIYSTCSVLPQENDEVVLRALRGVDAHLEPISPFEGIPLLPSMDGTICVCPNELYEGFYLAKIVKNGK